MRRVPFSEKKTSSPTTAEEALPPMSCLTPSVDEEGVVLLIPGKDGNPGMDGICVEGAVGKEEMLPLGNVTPGTVTGSPPSSEAGVDELSSPPTGGCAEVRFSNGKPVGLGNSGVLIFSGGKVVRLAGGRVVVGVHVIGGRVLIGAHVQDGRAGWVVWSACEGGGKVVDGFMGANVGNQGRFVDVLP